MNCPFCHPEQNGLQVVVLENELCWFLQEPDSTLVGSGVIVPKAHREGVFDLTPTEWAATYSLLHEVRQLLDATYAPDGYNVGWNNGRAAGQEILHVHLHVIPRFHDEPLAGKGIRYWLKQTGNRRKP
jgi:diadenosine tetraphosphate (Ap4A) HIT family hydrolase